MPAHFQRITEATVRALAGGKPNAGANEFIRDTSSPLMIVVGRTSSSFAVEGRQGRRGRNVRTVIGKLGRIDLDAARNEAMRLSTAIVTGVDVVQQSRTARDQREGEALTVGEATSALLAARELSAASIHDHERDRDRIGWANLPLSRITGPLVRAKFTELGGGTSASRAMRNLRSVWNFARSTNAAIPECPVKELKVVRKGWATAPRKTRTLPDLLLPRWRKALQQTSLEAEALTLFIHLTGCRVGEAKKLTAADIDLAARTVTFRDTKNGADCTLPLTRQTRAILAARLDVVKRGGLIFPTNDLRKSLRPTLAVCAWSWHDLRRTWLGAARRAGIDDLQARRLLNHADPAGDAHAGYFAPSPDELRPAAQAVDDFLDRLAKVRR